MKVSEVLEKANRGEGLTVEEIKIYNANVKEKKHVYGKYGTLAKQYIEEEAETILDPYFSALVPNKYLEDQIFSAIISVAVPPYFFRYSQRSIVVLIYFSYFSGLLVISFISNSSII